MKNLFSKREELVYDQLLKYKYSDVFEERDLAFDCIGILGNESINITLDQRLDYVEQMIREYINKKSIPEGDDNA